MSGWIKFEKDVRDNPRFRRMKRAYLEAHANDVTHVRFKEAYVATLLVGCLAQLWMYADSHIREDNTLDLGTDEIDELVGVEGFAQLMPADWLQVVDAHHVVLPGFQEHNGTEAKKKAQTQRRVERHRVRTVTQERNGSLTSGNAHALPDQTRPDQKRPDQTIQDARARESAQPETEAEIHAHVCTLKAKWPKGGRLDWISGEKYARQLVMEREATWPALESGVDRYAAHCRATGRTPMNPAQFFSAQDEPWRQDWELPPAPTRLNGNTARSAPAETPAEMAWNLLLSSGRAPAGDERAARALQAIGGLQVLRGKGVSTFEFPKLRAQFLRAYAGETQQ